MKWLILPLVHIFQIKRIYIIIYVNGTSRIQVQRKRSYWVLSSTSPHLGTIAMAILNVGVNLGWLRNSYTLKDIALLKSFREYVLSTSYSYTYLRLFKKG